MAEPHPSARSSDEPGRYEIRVKGHLDDRWAHRFGGLSLARFHDGTTLLAGSVVDQAALHSLLRMVRDLGLHLVSVYEVPPELEGWAGASRERQAP